MYGAWNRVEGDGSHSISIMNAMMVRRPAPRMLTRSVTAEKKTELQSLYSIGSFGLLMLLLVRIGASRTGRRLSALEGELNAHHSERLRQRDQTNY